MPKLAHLIFAAALLGSGAAAAQDPNASQAQDLANCAGAVSAFSGADLEALYPYPAGRSAIPMHGWPSILSGIAHALNREPGMEGATGLTAARAARAHWLEQTIAQRNDAAEACRARYAPDTRP